MEVDTLIKSLEFLVVDEEAGTFKSNTNQIFSDEQTATLPCFITLEESY